MQYKDDLYPGNGNAFEVSELSGSVAGIDVDIDKKSSHTNGSASTIYRYIGGIWSFQSLKTKS